MSSSDTAVRRRRQQVIDHQRAEQDEYEALKEHHDANLSQSLTVLLRGLASIIILGLAALYYYASPDYMYNLFKRIPQLPSRNLLILYPPDAVVRRHLPRLFQNYALATKDNVAARHYLQQVSEKRNVLTDAGIYYKQQSIQLHSWEILDDFLGQLPTESQQDGVCGMGFARAFLNYESSPSTTEELRHWAQHDLIAYCMMSLGTHDGYIHWNTTAKASLTRGLKGLAAVSERHVHSDFLLLPILSQKQIEARQTGAESVAPSTRVPIRTLQWLIQRGQGDLPASVTEYKHLLGEFLYRLVDSEGDSWVHAEAACTVEDREQMSPLYRLIATTCRAGGPLEDDCCSYYDPSIKPLVKRRRREDEEHADN